MSHYEERLQKDLDGIRDRVRTVSSDVEAAVSGAVGALLALDRPAASELVIGDLRINRRIREVDRLCHAFVARHLPSAGILRFVSAVLRLSVALERIGDYAVTICRETVQLTEAPPPAVARDIEMMADQVRRVFVQSMKAFLESNAELAKGTLGMAQQQGSIFDKVFADLIREGEERSRPIQDLFALLSTFNRLERVKDQAKNICEETVFAATGETKQPKVYRILFVGEANDFLSPMAEAIARKLFPVSGTYASGGWAPADALVPGLVEFMDQRGVDMDGIEPKQMSTQHDELSDYKVIVSLTPGAREQIPELPFHTVLLEWTIDAGDEQQPPEERLERAYKQIAEEVRDLMEAMQGEGAC